MKHLIKLVGYFPGIVALFLDKLNLKNKIILVIAWLCFWTLLVTYDANRDKIKGFFNSRIPEWWNFFNKIMEFVSSPVLRLIYVTLLLFLVSYLSKTFLIYLLCLLVWLIYAITYSSKEIKFRKAPKFVDGFEGTLLDNWDIVRGSAEIDAPFGKPSPSLVLPAGAGPENSMVLIKKSKIGDFRKGIIEFDVFLKTQAILNIIFRTDDEGKRGYMARIDSRGGQDPDRFLFKSDTSSWESRKDSNTSAAPDSWHHIKLKVRDSIFKLYQDEILVCVWEDFELSGSRIGLFNEIGEVHVDNFIVTT